MENPFADLATLTAPLDASDMSAPTSVNPFADLIVPVDSLPAKPVTSEAPNRVHPEAQRISQHEGMKFTSKGEIATYLDSLKVLTTGVGYNLETRTNLAFLKSAGGDIEKIKEEGFISQALSEKLFQHSLDTSWDDAKAFLPGLDRQPQEVQNVVHNMSFNLGLTKLRKFKSFRKALVAGKYEQAANEMVDSEWYTQVGDRAKDLEEDIRRLEPTSVQVNTPPTR